MNLASFGIRRSQSRKGHFAGHGRPTFMKTLKGFTLIELLVVIAIIGILSAVVLASLTTARTKGADAAIQSDLDSVRTEAEVYYNGSGNNTYGITASTCTAAGSMFATDPTIVNALTGIANNGGTAVCNSTASAYAVGSNLKTAGKYWCSDSSGQSKAETAALGAVTLCP